MLSRNSRVLKCGAARGRCDGETLGGAHTEKCGPGSLHVPARQGRARERRCPYGSGVGVPQGSQGRPKLAAEVFPRLSARPAAETQVHLTLVHKYISKGGTQLLGVF